MHTSALLGFAFSFALLAGCGGEDIVRGKQKTGGLSAAEYNRLVDLNRIAQDNIDARDAVHKMITPLLNEKSEPMSKKIANPNCVKDGDIPDNYFTGVIHTEDMSSPRGTCPIRWQRTRGWTLASKKMLIIDFLEVFDTDYRKLYSPMVMRSIEGNYQVVPQDNGRSKVAGTISIHNFQTLVHGSTKGTITIDYRPSGIDGAGTVVLSLSGNRWGVSGSINWRVRREGTSDVTYRLNNVQIDKDQFDQLFSSYELDKHMENAIKML